MAKLARLSLLERSLGEMVEAEKIAAMAEFAAGAGHEINNPLAVIAGRAQLLLQDETDPERRRDLALMNAQAMRVHEMIADLRLFATPPELERQSIDLAVLVRGLIDDLRPMAVAQETTLVLRGWGETGEEGWGEGESGRGGEGKASVSRSPDPPIPISADPVQLTVAIKSLCLNALEALGHRGRIEVVVGRLGDEARVSVADDGPGISSEQRPHIFEPFYSARQAGRGVGMGLSKCWRIANQHGGRVEVDRHAQLGAISRFACRWTFGGRRSDL